MKFMVMVRATPETESTSDPVAGNEDLLREMMAYNEALVEAGVMLAGDGLQPSAKGARVVFEGDGRTVVDGPFAETKELIAGYWVWTCASLADAVEWAKRCPNPTGQKSVLEIRQIYEADDFGDAAADIRAAEDRLRAHVQ